jgi:hypothetical protein
MSAPTPSPDAAQRASVIIEWENVQLAEMSRCQAMLRQLHKQARALRRQALAADGEERSLLQRFTEPVEVLVLFDDEAVGEADVARIVHPIIPPTDPNLELRLVAASGNEYYDQKNFGAQQAKGDFIVFLDSDVIPEDGWLQALLGSFEDPEVDVVCGNAYIDPYSTFAKAFALAWFFPLRSDDGPVYPTQEFFANNLAFRREILERFPFPSMPEGMTRGACVVLGRTLAENDVGVYRNPAARVSHPPPVGCCRSPSGRSPERSATTVISSCCLSPATGWPGCSPGHHGIARGIRCCGGHGNAGSSWLSSSSS